MGRDFLYSLRVLRKSPRFTLTAIVVLALGIGANSAIFSLVYSVLLRPLPYHDPAHLGVILASSEKRGGAFSVPPADFMDFAARNHTFSTMAAAESWGPSITGDGEAEELHGLRASASLFATLGVNAAIGRTFLPEDGRPGAPAVVVIGPGLWKRRFGADPNITGRTVTLNHKTYSIAGVLPERFYFPPFWALDAEIYTPLQWTPAQAQSRTMSTLRVFGRLKPGVSWEQAASDMRRIAAEMAHEFPATNEEKSAVVTPLHEKAIGNVRASLVILLGAVGCTLLIACANLANLFLARATARHKEVAIRQALGAARGALVRQLMTESLVLCFAGGVLGLLVAWWAVSAFAAGMPAAGNLRMPRNQEIGLDAPVIAFNFTLCLLTGLLFGLFPALRASRPDLNASLKEASRGTTADRTGLRIRGVLIVAEVALSLMLLAGAGLLVRSFQNLRDLDPGFDPRNVVAITLPVNGSDHAQPDRRAAFYREIVAQLQAMPGVRAASAVNHVPIAGDLFRFGLVIEARPAPESGGRAVRRVSRRAAGLFSNDGDAPRRGRDFNIHDNESTGAVAVVNETLARRIWPGENAIGKRFRVRGQRARSRGSRSSACFTMPSNRVGPSARGKRYTSLICRMPTTCTTRRAILSMTLVARTDGPVDCARAVAARAHTRHRPQHSHRRDYADGTRRRRCDVAAAHGDQRTFRLRPAGSCAGRHGNFRRDELSGHRAHAGDRHPYGAGSAAVRRASDGAAAIASACRCRSGARHCGGARAHAVDDHAALRGQPDGSDGADRSHAAARRGGGARGIAARAPRGADRSAGGAAPRLARGSSQKGHCYNRPNGFTQKRCTLALWLAPQRR